MHSVSVIAQLLWSFLPLCVRGEVTLTTATPWSNALSVKPTALYRRIAVDRYVGHQTRVLPDIFKLDSVDQRRRNHDNVWDWDYWCQLQAQKGNCTENVQRYYYNAQLYQCDRFSFSGCFGNKNNFETLFDCERHCKGAAILPLKHIDTKASCSLQPNAGLCVALFDKFYYDVNTRTCKVFVYGGCGGNHNRFASSKQCLSKCADKRSNKDK